MQQYADIYSLHTLHVSGVTAPIIRSTKTVSSTSGIGHAVKYRLKLTRVD